jgi:leucyl/phenylalanyl-tRNA---protein transferase
MVFNIESIIDGYSQGYFLMAEDDGELSWYSSKKRALIPLNEDFRYPKSLNRVLNQNRFSVAINRDFEGVCRGCANRDTTWLSEDLIELYIALYKEGWAYSFETWQGDQLAGGILGIAIKGAFIGESMFYNIPEGSKVAMVKLVEHLRAKDYVMFDAQMQNNHLARFGAYVIEQDKYQKLLNKAMGCDRSFK